MSPMNVSIKIAFSVLKLRGCIGFMNLILIFNTSSVISTTIVVCKSSFFSRSKHYYWELKDCLNIGKKKSNVSNFHPLVVVGGGSETLQVGEN